jgi:hypothetical protein
LNQIERSFAPVFGMPCWGVSRGYGSCLTLEFGVPRLEVREPRVPVREVSPRVQRQLARRVVRVRGRWHLWIFCCEWFVRANGKLVGDWTTPRRIDRAARELNGQKLRVVRVGLRGARTYFSFDLGAELETKPFDRSREQWMFYEPDGRVLSWRADRTFSYGPGNCPPEKMRWRKLSG